ncbi:MULTISPECIES: hypothetical protein [Nonomuraea]|uniref:Ornithine cyclodeaminase family protein n=1 Tax=Nonomuraea mangrovi TaxID=2316207 RepID=A0ABW4SNC8_9ACTN
MLSLTRTDVESLLDATDYIDLVQDAFAAPPALRGTGKGRLDADEIIVFDSTGTAVQDVAAARALYAAALSRGAGTVLPLWD